MKMYYVIYVSSKVSLLFTNSMQILKKKLNLIHYIYTLHYYRQIVNSTLGYCRFKQVKPEKIFTKPFSFKIEWRNELNERHNDMSERYGSNKFIQQTSVSVCEH